MRRKKNSPVITKIDMDENSEPIIVEVSEKEFLAHANHEEVDIQKADFVEMKSDKTIGKQMAMKRIFGITKDDIIYKRQKTFKTVISILFIVFMVGVLAFTAYKDFFASGRPVTTWEDIKQIFLSNWVFLLLAILSLGLFYFFKGFKLSVLCKSLTKKYHFRTCMETGIVGLYYNNITPLAVGGQPFEIYHLSKHGVHGGVASSMPIAAYFLNQIAFVLLSAVSLIFLKTNVLNTPEGLVSAFGTEFQVLAIIGLSTCILAPFLVIVFCLMPKVGAALVHFVIWLGSKLRIIRTPEQTEAKTVKNVIHNARCLKKLARKPLVALTAFIISLLENIACASIAFFSLKFFGFTTGVTESFIMEWLQVLQITFLLFVAVSFVPTPGNVGASDLSFFVLFSFGLTAGLAFPAMMVWRGLGFYSTILIGFLFATFKKKSELKQAEKEAQFATLEECESQPPIETASVLDDSEDTNIEEN
ncbi:MAG: flippase-like domain-containing protein [Clostridia bacterium]|nr:flippase-like domain-containing protein [Clostridia bacterium]